MFRRFTAFSGIIPLHEFSLGFITSIVFLFCCLLSGHDTSYVDLSLKVSEVHQH